MYRSQTTRFDSQCHNALMILRHRSVVLFALARARGAHQTEQTALRMKLQLSVGSGEDCHTYYDRQTSQDMFYTEMSRELICSVASDDMESSQIGSEILELQLLLKARGETELHCSEPIQYVCFIYFEITRLGCVDASVFEMVHMWWARWHPHSSGCIVRATSDSKLSINCPRTGHAISARRATSVFILSRIAILIVLTYCIYTGFYCRYNSWVDYTFMRQLLSE